MIETSPKLPKDRIGQLTMSLAQEFTPSLVPGEIVPQKIYQNYLQMYQMLDTFGKERVGEDRFTSRVWNLDGRPIYVASNQPLPETIQAVPFDVLSLVHGDIATDDPNAIKKVARRGDTLYGQGTLDMKWAAVAGIETIAHAPKDLPVGLIVCTNEETGGQDTAELIKRGFFDKTNIILCPDGAPIQGEIMSMVTAAKGGLRIKITPSHTLAVHEQLKQRAEFVHDAMQTIRSINKNRQETDAWDLVTFNPTELHDHPGRTPKTAGIVFNVEEENPEYVRAVTKALSGDAVFATFRDSQMHITTPRFDSHHSSRVLDTQAHPFEEVCRAVTWTFDRLEKDGRDPNLWKLDHAENEYQIAPQTGTMFDIRAGEEEAADDTLSIIEKIAQKHGIQSELVLRYPAYHATTDNPDWAEFERLAKETTDGSVARRRDFGNQDCRMFSKETTTIVLGIQGEMSHDPKENASLTAMDKATETIVQFVKSRRQKGITVYGS